ncbi:MAG: sulfotransferase, partial [Halioglobus sp.]
HEPRLLRNMILWYFDEVKLEKVHDKPEEVIYHLRTLYASYSLAAGSHWRRGVVMKLPHLCFYVPELYHALDPQFIVMTRDIDEIENTRERRGWHLALGRLGAEQCLEHMTRDFSALNLPYLEVAFEDLLADPRAQLGRMANFLGTTFTPPEVDTALEVLVRR